MQRRAPRIDRLHCSAALALSGAGLLAVLATGACETFDAPPAAQLPEAENGLVGGSPGDALVIEFSEPINPGTLRLMVVRADKRLDLDPEEFLPDEPEYCRVQRQDGQCTGKEDEAPCCHNEGLVKLLSYSGASGQAENAKVSLDGTRLVITPDPDVLQIALPYMVVIEPGLEDTAGNKTVPRTKLEFSYKSFAPGPTSMPTGPYFLLFDIEPPPVQLQLRLYAWLNFDAPTGDWEGLFTDANRTEALNGRPGCPGCGDGQICKLLPNADCVKPSVNLGSVDEFLDMIPVQKRPVGFTFQTTGFSGDLADGNTGFATPPFDIDIVTGSGAGTRITAADTVIVAQAAPDSSGRWRGSGNVSIGAVGLNGILGSATSATLTLMSLTPEEAAQAENCGHEGAAPAGHTCEPINKPGDI